MISCKINLKKILSVSVLLAFVVSAPLTHYIPFARYLFLVLFIIVATLDFYENTIKYDLLLFIIFVFVLIWISVFLSGLAPRSAFVFLYFYISILLGYYASQDYKIFLKIVNWILIINLPLLLYETATDHFVYGNNAGGLTITDLGVNVDSVDGRAKGVFSYTKEAAGFIIFSAIALREESKSNRFFVLAVALFSAIMTGTRLAMIIIFAILLMDLLLSISLNRQRLKRFIITSAAVFVAVMASVVFYFFKNPYAIFRMAKSLLIEHSSNAERIYFWKEHFKIFSNYNLPNMLFGRLGYAVDAVGNGSESTYLHLLTNGGIMAFTIYLIPVLLLSTKSLFCFKRYYPFIILLLGFQMARIGIGWADGVVFWAMIFHMLRGKICNAEQHCNSL